VFLPQKYLSPVEAGIAHPCLLQREQRHPSQLGKHRQSQMLVALEILHGQTLFSQGGTPGTRQLSFAETSPCLRPIHDNEMTVEQLRAELKAWLARTI